MNKTILRLAMAGLFFVAGMAEAKPIDVELVMGAGRSWKGQILSRKGDDIKFKSAGKQNAIGFSISSIKELVFDIDIDAEEVSEMMHNREFEQVIALLGKTMAPFSEYSDIPSNLTKYNVLLMELYYRTGQFDQSLAISAKISEDDRDPEIQEKSRVYRSLALIDAGRSAESKTLLSKYGWDQEMSADTPPEKRYIRAKILALDKQYGEAMEIIAQVIAFNSQDTEWIQPAEMLCAELYTELGLYDSAEEVCRQIEVLYKNTPEFDKAKQLKTKIEKLRAEQEQKERLAAEEA